MGDSFTFGLGVGDDENVPFQLEQILRARLNRSDVGVLNAGVISYSPIIHRSAFMEIVRHYSPTLTVLLLDIGDIGDDYKYAGQIVPGGASDVSRFEVNQPGFKRDSDLALAKLANRFSARCAFRFTFWDDSGRKGSRPPGTTPSRSTSTVSSRPIAGLRAESSSSILEPWLLGLARAGATLLFHQNATVPRIYAFRRQRVLRDVRDI